MEPRPSETRQTPRPSDRPVGTPRPSGNPVSSPTSILLLITSPSQHDWCGFGRWSYETCSCSCDVDRFPISEGTCAPCVLLENAPPPSPSSLSIQPTVGDFVIAIVRWSNSIYCLNGAITPSGVAQGYSSKEECYLTEHPDTFAGCYGHTGDEHWYPNWNDNSNSCLNDSNEPIQFGYVSFCFPDSYCSTIRSNTQESAALFANAFYQKYAVTGATKRILVQGLCELYDSVSRLCINHTSWFRARG